VPPPGFPVAPGAFDAPHHYLAICVSVCVLWDGGGGGCTICSLNYYFVLHLLFCVLLINYYVMCYKYEPYVHLNFYGILLKKKKM